jgi:hypothetical protein
MAMMMRDETNSKGGEMDIMIIEQRGRPTLGLGTWESKQQQQQQQPAEINLLLTCGSEELHL